MKEENARARERESVKKKRQRKRYSARERCLLVDSYI